MFAYLMSLVVIATSLAYLEIQIEGKYGWAEKLPCRRKRDGWIVKKILGGRPLTDYHLSIIAFLFVMFHFPKMFIPWSWEIESLIMGSLIGVIVLEDFFWFLYNPDYGLLNFRKEKIWWHPRWWGPVPDFYWYFPIIAGLLIFFGRSAIPIWQLWQFWQ